jgi:hypothetical protein
VALRDAQRRRVHARLQRAALQPGRAGAEAGEGDAGEEEEDVDEAEEGEVEETGPSDVVLLGDWLALAHASPFAFHGLTALRDALAAACGGVRAWDARRDAVSVVRARSGPSAELSGAGDEPPRAAVCGGVPAK